MSLSRFSNPRSFMRLGRIMDQMLFPRSVNSMMAQLENEMMRDFLDEPFFRDVLPRSSHMGRDRALNRNTKPVAVESKSGADNNANANAKASASENATTTSESDTEARSQTQPQAQAQSQSQTQITPAFSNSLWDGSLFDMEFTPSMDIVDRKDHFLVNVSLPGVKKDEFKVTITGDRDKILTVSGERKNEVKDEKEGRLIRYESSYGSFSRSVYVPNNVDAENIKAKYEDGVLKLTLPKTEPSKEEAPKQINVE